MRIKSIRVRRLVSGPGYENRAVEIDVEVGENQRPENVLREAQDWVDDQLGCPHAARNISLHDAEMLADAIYDAQATGDGLAQRFKPIIAAIVGQHVFRPGYRDRCRFCHEDANAHPSSQELPAPASAAIVDEMPF